MSTGQGNPKYIFVTGGVISSVGKGIAAASLAKLLKARGLDVAIQKLDPYLNVDPGTMSPRQHGEVFVTDDGAETDLDLGHYERFLDQDLTGESSVTMGQVSAAVIERERRGDYLGDTIQTIPHVTDAVQERIRGLARNADADVLIVEVGGTVGDIEGQAFLEAIRQMRYKEPHDATLAVHVTPLFHLPATGELKTKPTQHSVRTLRSAGIQPDVILARTEVPVDDAIREKVALFCDVPFDAVVPLPTAGSIYHVPQILDRAGLAGLVIDRLRLQTARRDGLEDWRRWVARLDSPERACSIAIVGKYVELRDAYLSVREALAHAGVEHGARIEIDWIQSDQLDGAGEGEIASLLSGRSGVLVPGGFGGRGIEGEVAVARYALEQQLPYLGLCRGMQNMVIAFARARKGWETATTTEQDAQTDRPVIALLDEQREVTDKGGTMRLGRYPCRLTAHTLAAEAYGLGKRPTPEEEAAAEGKRRAQRTTLAEIAAANRAAAQEEEQAGIASRLGRRLRPGRRARAAGPAGDPGGGEIGERHRHRWEFNPRYRAELSAAGLIASGTSLDGALVEIAEVRDHPFMLGTQFHPELRSRPGRPHPLFREFIRAVLAAETAPLRRAQAEASATEARPMNAE